MSSTPSKKRKTSTELTKHERAFKKAVGEYYMRRGRHHLPWRKTRDPYRILVSEIMLQQTQVERVIHKYKAFIQRFPSLSILAQAPLGEVLRLWQGLGYNRRAKMLHECAKVITNEFRGRTPNTREELESLPGIGPYTAGAVLAFAWNEPVPLIETNIRSVYLHHFFGDATDVTDTDILLLVERTLDHNDPRTWYYALMDYGVHIKQTFGNPNGRSKHYTRQSTFKGSDREIRGAILKALISKPMTRKSLITLLPFEDIRIDAQLARLANEEMLVYKKGRYTLPT